MDGRDSVIGLENSYQALLVLLSKFQYLFQLTNSLRYDCQNIWKDKETSYLISFVRHTPLSLHHLHLVFGYSGAIEQTALIPKKARR